MKFLFDLFPVILFFIAFKTEGIFVATGVAIAATFAQIGWVWFRHRKVDAMLWASLVIVTVFGGMTLLFHDENFIKLKLTIFYWVFAAVLLGANLFMGKNLIRSLLTSQGKFDMPDQVWRLLQLVAAPDLFQLLAQAGQQWSAHVAATALEAVCSMPHGGGIGIEQCLAQQAQTFIGVDKESIQQNRVFLFHHLAQRGEDLVIDMRLGHYRVTP